MKRVFTFFAVGSLALLSVALFAYAARTVYRFEVPKVEAERILFDFALPVGTCNLYAEEQDIPICLEGQLEEGDLRDVHFFYQPKGNDYEVDFSLSRQQKLSLEEMQMQRGQKQWKVMLSPKQTYGIRLGYGWGEATTDFSNIPLSLLHINTGHAHVRAIHREKMPNKAVMEGYKANVDYGNLHIENLDLANSPVFDAEVGVGNLSLTFSRDLYRSCQVNVNVGAGRLDVQLPDKGNGIRLKVGSSLMSSVSIPKGFQKHQGYLVNEAYLAKSAQNTVTFDISVSVGKVNFSWGGDS